MKKLLITSVLWFVLSNAHGQAIPNTSDTSKTEKKIKPLFQEDEILQLKIVTNLKVLLKDRGSKPQNHWASLSYKSDKDSVKIPIKLKPRGNFRLSSKNCIFPPLLLDFPKKKSGNTLFEAQNRLKLVTHCQSEDYIFQEYMVYQIYNLMTDYSFKARLAQVTYEDSLGKRAAQTRYAFLIEDEGDLAKRTRTKNYSIKQIPMARIDSLSLATVSVFEYLIGNSDWSVPFLHNIKLFTKNDHEYPLAVPYDFDHAGIVEAKYAQPPEALELISVRERLYRGITYSPQILAQVFEKFQAKKAAIYALYETNTKLNPNYVKRTLRYLDDFYKTINNPKEVKRIFVYGGGKPQGAGVVIKGLR